MNPIQKACSIVGSQAALAEKVGVSPAVVNQWISGYRPVPVERCAAIELATGGEVRREELRPADWMSIWPEISSRKPVAA